MAIRVGSKRYVNFVGFAKGMRVLGGEIDDNLVRMQAKIALGIHRDVILATPVDTGKARSNWQLTVGAPAMEELEPYAPGHRMGRGERANAQAAIAQGQAKLARLPGPGESIFITNNVDYINLLNETTHSMQAPPGFVDMAVLSGLIAGLGGTIVPK